MAKSYFRPVNWYKFIAIRFPVIIAIIGTYEIIDGNVVGIGLFFLGLSLTAMSEWFWNLFSFDGGRFIKFRNYASMFAIASVILTIYLFYVEIEPYL